MGRSIRTFIASPCRSTGTSQLIRKYLEELTLRMSLSLVCKGRDISSDWALWESLDAQPS